MGARMRLAALSAAVLAATAGTLAVGTSPAQAASQKIETRGGGWVACLSHYSATGTVSSSNCSDPTANVLRTSRSSYNGHPVVSVKFLKTGKCIDVGKQTSGNVKTNSCNSGYYQFLEVFNGSSKGTKVLKSIGAWEYQRVHLCLKNSGEPGVPIYWAKCSTSDSQQHFRFL